jgi:hypothetical protein
MRLHPVTERKAGPARRPADAMPRWVKIFSAVALIVIAIIASFHLVGGGMGHLAHDEADVHVHTTPTGLGQRSP